MALKFKNHLAPWIIKSFLDGLCLNDLYLRVNKKLLIIDNIPDDVIGNYVLRLIDNCIYNQAQLPHKDYISYFYALYYPLQPWYLRPYVTSKYKWTYFINLSNLKLSPLIENGFSVLNKTKSTYGIDYIIRAFDKDESDKVFSFISSCLKQKATIAVNSVYKEDHIWF